MNVPRLFCCALAGALFGTVCGAILRPAVASAHGREASLNRVLFDPTDHDRVVLRATWGFLTTRDGGRSWVWHCAAAVPFDRLGEDPPMVMVPDGSIVTATLRDQLRLSDPSACDWSAPSVSPPQGFTLDVIAQPRDPRELLAIHSPGSSADSIYRSADSGGSWARLSELPASVLSDRVRVAPSDPRRLYVSAVERRTPLPDGGLAPKVGALLRSDDGGMSWAITKVPMIEGEVSLLLLGIDPDDPDRLLMRASRYVADPVAERLLLSEDGGRTWSAVLHILEIVGFAMSGDGQTVWVGSWDGGFYRSVDRGRTFELVSDIQIRCLEWREGDATWPAELWVCVDGFRYDYAVGRSLDGGDTIEPLWSFDDLQEPVGCPAGTTVGDLCPAYWSDMLLDVRGIAPGSDGGVTAMPSPASCSCRLGGGLTPAWGIVGAVALACLARRRRSRRPGLR